MALKLKITIDNRVIEKIMLKARKTVDGNIIILDHPEIDIYVLANKNKIVAAPKEQMDDEMSMECKMLDAKEGDKIQFALYTISQFIDNDLPFYDNLKDFEKEMEDQLLAPEEDEYTEFDAEKYHSDMKGSLPPRYARYGIHNIYRI